MTFVRTVWIILVALFFSFTTRAAHVISYPTLQRDQAQRLIGLKVENQDGFYLGKIKNMIVDISSGQVPYVLISSGGFLGIGAQTRIVPAVALVAGTAKRGIASLDIAKTVWDKLPPFKKKDLRTLGSEERRREIFAATGLAIPAGHVSTTRSSGAYQLSPTGPTASSNAPSSPATPALHLVTDIVGRDVINPRHEPVGEVLDLLIDFSGKRPPFAIISADRLLRRSQSFAVPLSSLKPAEKERLVLEATRPDFEAAVPFNESVWQNAAGGRDGIYLYQEVAPDNTGLNARDRSPRSMTPLKQSERTSDLELTRKLRRAIMNDRSLSFTSKNIKIITANGRLALRGPVPREPDKAAILRHAREIAPAAAIQDELEVTP